MDFRAGRGLVGLLLSFFIFESKTFGALETQEWIKCKSEIEQRLFPRTCLILAVASQKLQYPDIHQQMESYCLKHIEQWTPLDSADLLILEKYFPKCSYRSHSISSANNESLSVENLKLNLVRFLYLEQNANPTQDSKRVSNTISTGPGSK